jgi:hypothetical protein
VPEDGPGNARSRVFLHLEQIRFILLKRVGPDLDLVADPDQPGRDSNPARMFAQRAFNHVVNAQVSRDLIERRARILITHH